MSALAFCAGHAFASKYSSVTSRRPLPTGNFLSAAQNISLYMVWRGNVSNSRGTSSASKLCRKNALKGFTEVGEAFALEKTAAGLRGLTKFVNPRWQGEAAVRAHKGEQGQRI